MNRAERRRQKKLAKQTTQVKPVEQPNPAKAQEALQKGIRFHQQSRIDEAISWYQKSLDFHPNHPATMNNMGCALLSRGETAQAVACYQKALAIQADYPDALSNLGHALTLQGRLNEAVINLQKALAIKPDFADALKNLGLALTEQGVLDKAVAILEKAIAIKPDGTAFYNLGIALSEQGKLERAVHCYQRAIALKPDHAEAFGNLGNTLTKQGRLDTAVQCYRKATTLKPDYADGFYNLGIALSEQGNLPAALASHQQAVRLMPDNASYLAKAVHLQLQLNDWHELATNQQRMLTLFQEGKGRISPFILLSMPISAVLLRQYAEHYVQNKIKTTTDLSASGHYDPKPDRLKIGYLSCDFQNHATAYLLTELLELHDHDHFEIMIYSYGGNDDREMRRRIMAASDHFIDISLLDHQAAAKKIHGDGVHILIDLKGFTKGGRTEIVAYHPAPIQVNWLGFPGTMGAPFMDYIFTDAFVTPPGCEDHFNEQVIRLADCYQPNDRQRPISTRRATRKEYDLPQRGFVFASFNNTYKITPDIFNIWMTLLRKKPESILWLLESNRWAVGNLRRAAEARGVDGSRLIFAPKKPLAEHLARYRLADLVLDTYPVTSHTTASDALWAGCPLLTCVGETFVSRVAGSLLANTGMAELITHSLAEYAESAWQLAQDPPRLAALRAKLQNNRLTTPLFDSPRFSKNLESTYLALWKRWCDEKKTASRADHGADFSTLCKN
jgi:predicted O-linked N-acetylglucosamine transferase (SPINDLY family)